MCQTENRTFDEAKLELETPTRAPLLPYPLPADRRRLCFRWGPGLLGSAICSPSLRNQHRHSTTQTAQFFASWMSFDDVLPKRNSSVLVL